MGHVLGDLLQMGFNLQQKDNSAEVFIRKPVDLLSQFRCKLTEDEIQRFLEASKTLQCFAILVQLRIRHGLDLKLQEDIGSKIFDFGKPRILRIKTRKFKVLTSAGKSLTQLKNQDGFVEFSFFDIGMDHFFRHKATHSIQLGIDLLHIHRSCLVKCRKVLGKTKTFIYKSTEKRISLFINVLTDCFLASSESLLLTGSSGVDFKICQFAEFVNLFTTPELRDIPLEFTTLRDLGYTMIVLG